MISRFNRWLFAFTSVAPLLLSIAIVLFLLHSSEYLSEWSGLIHNGDIPKSGIWWMISVYFVLFVALWIWVGAFLNKLNKLKRGVRSLTLSSLQRKSIDNIVQAVSMLLSLVSIMADKAMLLVLGLLVLLPLGLAIIFYYRGRIGLMCLICGYKVYEGQVKDGMKLQLVSKRTWSNPNDIHDIVYLSDESALIVN